MSKFVLYDVKKNRQELLMSKIRESSNDDVTNLALILEYMKI